MRSSRFPVWLRSEWRWLLASILAAHFVLSTVYSVVTPVWEGPDELGHYQHVRFLIRNLALPGPEDSTTALDELTHPPLYYIVTATLTFWVDTSDNLEPIANPFAATGIMEGGANRFLHSDAEAFPYRGTVLAVHTARLVSIAMGTLSLLVTYKLGRLLFPHRHDIALGATAINAFTPGFLFMSGVINNDIMVTLFTGLTLLLSVRLIVGDAGWRTLLALGVCTGLAVLSKYNGLALVPLVIVSVGVGLARRIRLRKSLVFSLGGVLLLLLGLALVSSWWFVRSVVLFGSATTRSDRVLAQFLEDLRDPAAGLNWVDWALLQDGLSYFYQSFWGVFGWGNVNAATWVYQVLGVLSVAGLVGLVLFLLGKASRSVKGGALILLLGLVVFCALAIYRTLTFADPVLRGRYVLPAISGISVLLSLGVVHLTPRRLGPLPILLASLTVFFLGFIAPFRYIMPAYARPLILSADAPLPVQNQLNLRFGDKIELVGYDLGVSRATAGQFVPITFYWRTLGEMEQDYTVGVSLLGPDGTPYGKIASYPGHGNYPTSLWKAGKIIEDTYQVRLGRKFPAPALARVYVALYTYPAQEHLPVFNEQGAAAGQAAVFGALPVDAAQTPDYVVQHELSYQLGDSVALLGYDLEDSLFRAGCGCVTLYWQALDEVEEDYSVFVHVVDDRDQTVAQNDSKPRAGFYPTTYWRQGETVADQYCLSLPSDVQKGHYQVLVGMYVPENMQRLAAFDADGNRIPSDRCLLSDGSITSATYRSYLPAVFQEP
jgi:4-amino-4-deoxy-L-arabinose transferase-like glycosyltransferase